MQEKTLELYPKIIKNNWTVLDIGAYEGIHSQIFARLADQGKVYSFEPMPSNYNLLYENVKNYKNVTTINKAVSNIDGTTNLYYGKLCGSSESNIRGKDLDENPTQIICSIECVTIDNYFKLEEKIDFIKIDVEGAENLVLEGMKQTLLKYKPILIIEFHNDEGWEGAFVLDSIGYKILNVYSNFTECSMTKERGCYHGVAMPREVNILL